MKIIKKLLSFGTALLLSLSSLLMFAPAVHAVPKTCTWTGGGGDAKFSTAGNWSGCASAAPLAGDSLAFPALGTKQAPINDTSLTYAAISFTGASDTCSASPYAWYAITGTQALSLSGNISNTMTGSCSTVNIDSDVSLTANISVTGTNNVYFGQSVVKTISLGSNSLTFAGTYASVNSAITGAAGSSIIQNGSGLNLYGSNPSFSGSIVLNSGYTTIYSTAYGDTTGGTTVNSGASLYTSLYKGTTLSEPITLNGASNNPDSAKLGLNPYGDQADYADDATSVLSITYNGALTLGADATISVGFYRSVLTISGALSGAHKITRLDGDSGKLTLAASPNDSQTPNGDIASARKENTISANQAYGNYTYGNNQTTINEGVTVTGDSQVSDDGILILKGKIIGTLLAKNDSIVKGTGTVEGPVTLSQKAKLAPGLSPGCLSTGNLTFVSGTSYDFEVGGTTACTEYDQTKVTGTVDVTNATLNVIMYNGFKAAVGQKYTIIDNDSSDAVTGTFAGLAEGATATSGKYSFKISYKGGDGNDVVLSVIGVPDTGFTLVTDHPAMTLAVTTALAGGILLTSRRYKKVFVRR